MIYEKSRPKRAGMSPVWSLHGAAPWPIPHEHGFARAMGQGRAQVWAHRDRYPEGRQVHGFFGLTSNGTLPPGGGPFKRSMVIGRKIHAQRECTPVSTRVAAMAPRSK